MVSITTNPQDLCASPSVDVVFVINSDEYHADHAILALEHNKFVFVEKPLALNIRDIDRIKAAERASQGKLMVGYMRRHAAAFVDGVKEIGGMGEILFARVRDIIGPNNAFVSQSGTFPKRFMDIPPEVVEEKNARAAELTRQGLVSECGVPMTEATTSMWRILGGLGSHDLSAMREVLGMPTKVLGANLGFPFWNVIFQYPGFAVSYESGIDSIPRFDAHIEIYSQTKSVRIQFDTPYVKGLPTTLHICERDHDGYRETTFRRTYEDPYTLQLKELYNWVLRGTPVKTTAADAEQDCRIFQMILNAGASTS
ncbi:NAD binding Rossmann fold oxidoreductase [Aspergillus uvarum CBS 121591]|uniref:NAD binding Rossmann fold oxidoreductase n=1 Tax=Aspergillus uvarum CBS 121591 TaxID=1448315 RepID=A0A319D164_9EURO|nr:NAD binding Rossmann fold oxidoreductase [Aspergillus uvarum CBS 121591]PYH84783.1 NAD binding Rossmann fold oxidoreductase [Aspergillus uvarum CBS 121591]